MDHARPRAREPSDQAPEEAPREQNFAEALNQGAITSSVFKNCLGHPATTYPLAGAAVCGFAMTLLGGAAALFPLAIFGAVIGTGSFIVNFFFRYERYSEQYVADIMAKRETAREAELETLRENCDQLEFHEGRKELDELIAAYQKFKDFLVKQIQAGKGTQPGQFVILAEDAFKKGLGFIKAAIQVKQALLAVNVEELGDELDAWRSQKKRLESQVKQGSQVAKTELSLLERKMEINERRIAAHGERTKLIDTLLAKSNDQEGALELAYLELVELLEGDVTSPISEGEREQSPLERRVAAARRVEEKLRAVGSTSDEDEMYLKAAHERQNGN